ncbi:RNA polymerase II transcription subunit 21 mediator [Nannizzia gypsea CBS 118893]|uniref:Mediator of RNA polymerase II transcription subunit 21 n=1 Tax=Arthroderma gypseum (strain ATCC MYA-4604 / CBS 118893) TaxID=535722 RepID=E4UQY8_ARTGP|nr:RNA polymerase II transcription subunit 21 mediator [Nannizzia gypsea CBS 118893]EFQ99314.1 RNA polymerase II transcription subunit 21 mediator [Nannizzia gypsea CBS 118893]
MADILTQLQTCLDQLATQFYATLCYLTTYHDHSPAIPPSNVPTAIPQLKKIPKNAPPNAPAAQPASGQAQGQDQKGQTPQQQQQQGGDAAGGAQEQNRDLPPRPDSPNTFAQRQRELARDLIIKEQQIEYLISVLPGIGSSEAEQEARIRQLADELREAEKIRKRKRKQMKKLAEKVDGLLEAVSRGI